MSFSNHSSDHRLAANGGRAKKRTEHHHRALHVAVLHGVLQSGLNAAGAVHGQPLAVVHGEVYGDIVYSRQDVQDSV